MPFTKYKKNKILIDEFTYEISASNVAVCRNYSKLKIQAIARILSKVIKNILIFRLEAKMLLR